MFAEFHVIRPDSRRDDSRKFAGTGPIRLKNKIFDRLHEECLITFCRVDPKFPVRHFEMPTRSRFAVDETLRAQKCSEIKRESRRAQVTRLIHCFKKRRDVKPRVYKRHLFTVRYSRADIELLAETDEAHPYFFGSSHGDDEGGSPMRRQD